MKSEYENETIEGIDLASQKIENRVFSSCRFVNVNFSTADLQKSRFLDCIFVGCNLSNALLSSCRLQDVRFESCKMIGIDFTKCDPLFFRVSFHKCILNLSNFSTLKLSCTAFKECILREADFVEANIAKADFSHCDLKGAVFNKTDLRGANFVGAKDYLINPLNNKIQKARFEIPEVISLLSAFDIAIE